jgi:Zn-dependent M28 family amino/carboxypeptidase
VIQNNGAEENFLIDSPGSGYQVDFLAWIDKSIAETIAASMGNSLDGLFKMAASREFKPITTGYRLSAKIKNIIRKTETRNVVGVLPGSDPELKDEVIVFSAHYDHLGVNEDLEGDDKIYNGAWDNALGTSAIINIAEAFASLETKPKRSILFLACAAEESGLIGSKWFVAQPPIARNRIVANFNIDMPQIFGITRDIAAIGLEMNSLGETLKDVASEYRVTNDSGVEEQLEVKGDPNPNAGSYYRSDQVNFAKVGIPALYFKPGNDYLNTPAVDPKEYKDTHYHRVNDEIKDFWDLSGCERDMRVIFETAMRVANYPEMPRWVPGNEFEEEWLKLHGKESSSLK